MGSLFVKDHKQLLVAGLAGSGKTTTTYRVKFQDQDLVVPRTIPGVECVEGTISKRPVTMRVLCLGEHVRCTDHHGYGCGTHGVMFVVDAANRDKVAEAARELHSLLRADGVASGGRLRDLVVLVLGNKSDLPGAMAEADLREALKLDTLPQEVVRESHLAMCSVKTAEGCDQAWTWLDTALG